MERADQAIQARQRQSAPHPVLGGVTKPSPGNIPLWGLLPAPGGSGHEKGHGGRGSDAQNVDCRRPSHPDGGELRSGESGRTGSKLAARLACCLYGAPTPKGCGSKAFDGVPEPREKVCSGRGSTVFHLTLVGEYFGRGGLDKSFGFYS